jgi:hypothetical protein
MAMTPRVRKTCKVLVSGSDEVADEVVAGSVDLGDQPLHVLSGATLRIRPAQPQKETF